MTELMTFVTVAIVAFVFLGLFTPLSFLRSLAWRTAMLLVLVWIALALVGQLAVFVVDSVRQVDLRSLTVAGLVAGGLGALAFEYGFGRATPKVWTRAHSASNLVPSFEPFVGKDLNGQLLTVLAQDTIGVIGPPRSGKTSILIAQLLNWAGPAISVSVRPDVAIATGDQRLRLAKKYGGKIYYFDPSESTRNELAALAGGHWEYIPTVRWSPIRGCELPQRAVLMAEAMVRSAAAIRGGQHQRHPHFEDLAIKLLKGMLHVAALNGQTIEDVVSWANGHEYMAVAGALRESSSSERIGWAKDLESMADLSVEEAGSAFSTLQNALAAFSLSIVQENSKDTDFDLWQFIKTRSTLYVVAGAMMQDALAPLFSAMIESIAFRLIEDEAQKTLGRLEPRVLLQIDELPNIAPLPSIVKLITQAGGRGLCLVYAAQTWAQLTDRYGLPGMRSIWHSTKAHIVFGGTNDLEMLRQISGLHGRKRKVVVTVNTPRFDFFFNRTHSRTITEEPRIHEDEIQTPPHDNQHGAHVFYNGGFQPIKPAPVNDPQRGQPFYSASGWHPSTPSSMQLQKYAEV
jgi:type IV secretory pathway TraG/TraD family ATPase VirD4